MTAHVAYPALDPKLPATLSEAIVTGLLPSSWVTTASFSAMT